MRKEIEKMKEVMNNEEFVLVENKPSSTMKYNKITSLFFDSKPSSPSGT